MANTITSANSSFVISSADFLPAAVALEGYSADAAFAIEAADTAETIIGVDGKMSAGWLPRLYKQTINLQADSGSRAIFDALAQAQDVNKEVYFLNAVISLPSIGRSYTLSKGVLSSYKVLPDAGKTLQPTEFVITWEKVQPAISI
jgi:hypothetical protein